MLKPKHVANTDFVLFFLGAVFTIASAGLSGYFGWLRADGAEWFVQYASAFICGGIAIALAMFVIRRERLRYQGERTSAYKSASRAVMIFLVANLFTDFMATRALLNLTSTKADNINTAAVNARNYLASLEQEVSTLTHDNAGNTVLLRPPSAYTAQIAAKEEEMRQESLRGCRNPPCQGKNYLEDAQQLAHLKDLQSRAQRLADVRAKIPAAKAEVAKHGKVADAANSPVDGLTSLIVQRLDPSDDQKQWGQVLFILFLTGVFSGGIYFMSKEQGRRLGPLPEYAAFGFDFDDEVEVVSRPKQIATDHAPIPLKAEDAPASSSTTTSSTVHVYSRGANQKVLDELINEVLAGVQQDRASLTRH